MYFLILRNRTLAASALLATVALGMKWPYRNVKERAHVDVEITNPVGWACGQQRMNFRNYYFKMDMDKNGIIHLNSLDGEIDIVAKDKISFSNAHAGPKVVLVHDNSIIKKPDGTDNNIELWFPTIIQKTIWISECKKQLRLLKNKKPEEEKLEKPQVEELKKLEKKKLEEEKLEKPQVEELKKLEKKKLEERVKQLKQERDQRDQWLGQQLLAKEQPKISDEAAEAIRRAPVISKKDMLDIIQKQLPTADYPWSDLRNLQYDQGIHISAGAFKVMSAQHVIEIYNKRMKNPNGTKMFNYKHGTFECYDFGTVFHTMVKQEQYQAETLAPFAIAEAWNAGHVCNIVIVPNDRYNGISDDVNEKYSVMVFEPQDGSFYVGATLRELAGYAVNPLSKYDKKITFVKF